jgi:hypothetical protein
MSDETENTGANLKMHMMGKRYRAGRVKEKPIGDKMINAVQDAIWEAWEIGLDDKSGQSIYPTFPLLDGEAVEPDEPEM